MSTTAFEVTPLSKCRHPYGLQRVYAEDLPRREKRILGDTELLVMLEEECHPRLSNADEGRLVAELGAGRLRWIVEIVEAKHPGWSLAGDPGQAILERLDAHFADVQEAWLRSRTESEERMRRYAVESAQLDEDLAVRRVEDDRRLWGLPAA